MAAKKNIDQFIADARKVHGDKWNYDKSVYKNNKTKITIGCPKHGDFEHSPNDHLTGNGCKICGYARLSDKSRKSLTVFIKEAREVHGSFYEYSRVVYKKNNVKVEIGCPKHGWFKQTPINHLKGRGCKICGYKKNGDRCRKSIEQFIEEAHEIHGNFYDYSRVVYQTNENPIEIGCPKHGFFSQLPRDHLSGCGCLKCGSVKCGDSMRWSTEEFITLSRKKHGDHYDYSRVDYKSSRIHVEIGCPKHGWFKQKPCNHITGSGCPTCNESKGEKAIREYLTKHKIKKTPQWRFKNSSISKQRFDFGIKHPKFTGVIEYQGSPHFKPCAFGSKGKYSKSKLIIYSIKRDHKKLQWCRQHNIPLLLIPYWDYDRIPEILDDVLAGRTPTFSEAPEMVEEHKDMRDKIREHLGITEPEVLCGLITQTFLCAVDK